ncbi:DUF6804 family protein [Gulosibacter chungangensis]|uniref:Uncharacterized protein n=1 Tax=Gulosibacter chungangensis TaxID=979746 RepID=A0A7J5B891_9MICO|nr:DUF6804 family protein [Gulosibacter chungangensis]KAB1641425.1 hypothetical protein F8O05_12635 [Gulosibacter chungangensis]
MNQKQQTPSYQRNALLPGFIALAVLIVGVAFVGTDWFTVFRCIIAILALIVTWFAVQARHWWWVPVLLAIAVLWNPVYPFGFSGIFWILAQPIAGSVFLIAGALIKQPRPDAVRR